MIKGDKSVIGTLSIPRYFLFQTPDVLLIIFSASLYVLLFQLIKGPDRPNLTEDMH